MGGAFGIDLGLTVVDGRQVQAIADTAALDMARYVNVADWGGLYNTQAKATTYLTGKPPNAATDNGSNATLSETPVVCLVWCLHPHLSKVVVETAIGPETETVYCWDYTPRRPQRCNAIKITAKQSVPQIFVGGSSSVTRSAIAAVSPEAGFSIGSYLASLNSQQSTVLNTLMGTLGGSGNVTLLGYEGLANTNVTINQLITVSGGLLTTSNVLTASLYASQWQSIWNAAVANQVALLNCSATPTPAPCNVASALSGTNALDFGSAAQDAGPTLPARVDQQLHVHRRQPLDPGPLGQPQRGADAHHRGGVGERDQRTRLRDVTRHHWRHGRQVDSRPGSALPSRLRTRRHDGIHGPDEQ